MSFASPGLRELQAWSEDLALLPPAAARLGISIQQVGPQSITLASPWRRELLLPDGRPSVSAYGVLIDFGLAAAVLATTRGPASVTTLSTTINYVTPPRQATQLTGSFNTLEDGDDATRMSTGQVRDQSGRLLASASGWLLVTRPTSKDTQICPEAEPSPETSAADVFALLGDRRSAINSNNGASHEEHQLQFRVRAALTNPVGMLHGGVGAMACEAAVERFLGPKWRLITSSLTYLRPAPVRSTLRASTRFVRKGRRTALVEVAIRTAEHRDVVRGTSLAHLEEQ